MPRERKRKNVATFVGLTDFSKFPDIMRMPREKLEKVLKRGEKEGIIHGKNLIEAKPVDQRDLLLAHEREYVSDFLHMRSTGRTMFGGLPLDASIRDLHILNTGATVIGLDLALESGIAMVLGGGAIHAFETYAEGYCYLNDIAVALLGARVTGRIDRGAVISCDAHQANGVAAILGGRSDMFVFSIYEAEGYPYRKVKSDMDIPLHRGIRDDDYLILLENALPRVLDDFRPDIVVYLAASDPFENDPGSGLSLSMEGLRRRDEMVIGETRRRGIPVLVLIGGGASENLEETVEIHMNTVRIVRRFADLEGQPRSK
jgi:acetoin utilization deacetylase AcuC-like enzyme